MAEIMDVTNTKRDTESRLQEDLTNSEMSGVGMSMLWLNALKDVAEAAKSYQSLWEEGSEKSEENKRKGLSRFFCAGRKKKSKKRKQQQPKQNFVKSDTWPRQKSPDFQSEKDNFKNAKPFANKGNTFERFSDSATTLPLMNEHRKHQLEKQLVAPRNRAEDPIEISAPEKKKRIKHAALLEKNGKILEPEKHIAKESNPQNSKKEKVLNENNSTADSKGIVRNDVDRKAGQTTEFTPTSDSNSDKNEHEKKNFQDDMINNIFPPYQNHVTLDEQQPLKTSDDKNGNVHTNDEQKLKSDAKSDSLKPKKRSKSNREQACEDSVCNDNRTELAASEKLKPKRWCTEATYHRQLIGDNPVVESVTFKRGKPSRGTVKRCALTVEWLLTKTTIVEDVTTIYHTAGLWVEYDVLKTPLTEDIIVHKNDRTNDGGILESERLVKEKESSNAEELDLDTKLIMSAVRDVCVKDVGDSKTELTKPTKPSELSGPASNSNSFSGSIENQQDAGHTNLKEPGAVLININKNVGTWVWDDNNLLTNDFDHGVQLLPPEDVGSRDEKTLGKISRNSDDPRIRDNISKNDIPAADSNDNNDYVNSGLAISNLPKTQKRFLHNKINEQFLSADSDTSGDQNSSLNAYTNSAELFQMQDPYEDELQFSTPLEYLEPIFHDDEKVFAENLDSALQREFCGNDWKIGNRLILGKQTIPGESNVAVSGSPDNLHFVKDNIYQGKFPKRFPRDADINAEARGNVVPDNLIRTVPTDFLQVDIEYPNSNTTDIAVDFPLKRHDNGKDMQVKSCLRMNNPENNIAESSSKSMTDEMDASENEEDYLSPLNLSVTSNSRNNSFYPQWNSDRMINVQRDQLVLATDFSSYSDSGFETESDLLSPENQQLSRRSLATSLFAQENASAEFRKDLFVQENAPAEFRKEKELNYEDWISSRLTPVRRGRLCKRSSLPGYVEKERVSYILKRDNSEPEDDSLEGPSNESRGKPARNMRSSGQCANDKLPRNKRDDTAFSKVFKEEFKKSTNDDNDVSENTQTFNFHSNSLNQVCKNKLANDDDDEEVDNSSALNIQHADENLLGKTRNLTETRGTVDNPIYLYMLDGENEQLNSHVIEPGTNAQMFNDKFDPTGKVLACSYLEKLIDDKVNLDSRDTEINSYSIPKTNEERMAKMFLIPLHDDSVNTKLTKQTRSIPNARKETKCTSLDSNKKKSGSKQLRRNKQTDENKLDPMLAGEVLKLVPCDDNDIDSDWMADEQECESLPAIVDAEKKSQPFGVACSDKNIPIFDKLIADEATRCLPSEQQLDESNGNIPITRSILYTTPNGKNNDNFIPSEETGVMLAREKVRKDQGSGPVTKDVAKTIQGKRNTNNFTDDVETKIRPAGEQASIIGGSKQFTNNNIETKGGESNVESIMVDEEKKINVLAAEESTCKNWQIKENFGKTMPHKQIVDNFLADVGTTFTPSEKQFNFNKNDRNKPIMDISNAVPSGQNVDSFMADRVTEFVPTEEGVSFGNSLITKNTANTMLQGETNEEDVMAPVETTFRPGNELSTTHESKPFTENILETTAGKLNISSVIADETTEFIPTEDKAGKTHGNRQMTENTVKAQQNEQTVDNFNAGVKANFFPSTKEFNKSIGNRPIADNISNSIPSGENVDDFMTYEGTECMPTEENVSKSLGNRPVTKNITKTIQGEQNMDSFMTNEGNKIFSNREKFSKISENRPITENILNITPGEENIDNFMADEGRKFTPFEKEIIESPENGSISVNITKTPNEQDNDNFIADEETCFMPSGEKASKIHGNGPIKENLSKKAPDGQIIDNSMVDHGTKIKPSGEKFMMADFGTKFIPPMVNTNKRQEIMPATKNIVDAKTCEHNAEILIGEEKITNRFILPTANKTKIPPDTPFAENTDQTKKKKVPTATLR